jgi:hypothetical protein
MIETAGYKHKATTPGDVVALYKEKWLTIKWVFGSIHDRSPNA